MRRSQWPRGLRRRSATARWLRPWVRIPPGAWMFVCCECCVLSALRRADHSSRGVLPTVVRRCVWSRNLKNEEAMTRVGSQRHKKKLYVHKICSSDVNQSATCFGTSQVPPGSPISSPHYAFKMARCYWQDSLMMASVMCRNIVGIG